MKQKRIPPKLGDECWEVEWADEEPPLDECGDFQPDLVWYKKKYFTTEERAWEYAKEVYPSCIFGSVRITHMVYSDEIGDGDPRFYGWVAIGEESEFYEGD